MIASPLHRTPNKAAARTARWVAAGLCAAAAAGPPPHPHNFPPSDPTLTTEEKVASLREAAVPLRSIDPLDDDFADLRFLQTTIGDKRIVMLGEANHGDGAALAVKARIVKFLHQEMGFEVVVFESGLYDCWKMDQAFTEGKDPRLAAPDGAFAEWYQSPWAFPMFDYAWTSGFSQRPLRFAGFDHQVTGTRTWRLFGEDLLELIERLEEARVSDEEAEQLMTVVERLERTTLTNDKALVGLWEELLEIERRVADLKPKSPQDEQLLAWWRRFARDMVVNVEAKLDGLWEDLSDLDFYNSRDLQMGRNMVWLANQGLKDKKIILWAATFHMLADASAIETPEQPGVLRFTQVAGEQLHAESPEDIYSIAVVTDHGQMGRPMWPEPRDVQPSTPGGFEDLASRVGHPFLFVDLTRLPQSHWLRKPLTAKTLGTIWFDNQTPNEAFEDGGLGDVHARWAQQINAFLFIETMFPASAPRRLDNSGLPLGATLKAPLPDWANN